MIEQINHIAQLWWSGAAAMFWQVGVLIILIGCVDFNYSQMGLAAASIRPVADGTVKACPAAYDFFVNQHYIRTATFGQKDSNKRNPARESERNDGYDTRKF
ncbi:MAG: hypothetical protein JXA81_04445 [Sedimentisphaerales bacterium]|nr:hypothetical protein [Sedimentisphaerales bacterium]